MLNRPEEFDRMAQVEGEHWWYRALHQLVADATALHPRRRQARVLDAGCGAGGLLQFLRALGFPHLSGFDISETALELCRQRGLPVIKGDLREAERMAAAESQEVIVSNDTLYFFTPAEQEEIVDGLRRLLAPGGLLVLNLPALKAFRGRHDLAVGIRQRFSRADIGRLLKPARFELCRACFWPFWLAPAIYGARLAQRCRLRLDPALEIKSDLWLPPRWLNAGLARLTRWENAWLPWKPLGSSLFLVARKR